MMAKSNWKGQFPEPVEYANYYAGYVELVPKGNILDTLKSQMHEMYTFIHSIPGDKVFTPYEEGKWTIKQILGHLIETERVFAYRALSFSRGASEALPSMDQDMFVEEADHDRHSINALGNEYLAVRISSIHLFQNMTAEMIARKGKASGVKFTVRAIPFIIAGHELHHKHIIQERYL